MIELSKKQIRALKAIKRYKNFEKVLSKLNYKLDDYIEFQRLFPNSFDYMIFSDNRFDNKTTVELTEYAHSIIENKHRENFRFWFPVIVSILALVVSIIRIFC